MKRWIPIDQLKPGMYVAEIKNISWIKHPFLRNQHLIKNEDEAQVLKDCGGCEVYIDTDVGDDLDPEQNKPDDLQNTSIGTGTPTPPDLKKLFSFSMSRRPCPIWMGTENCKERRSSCFSRSIPKFWLDSALRSQTRMPKPWNVKHIPSKELPGISVQPQHTRRPFGLNR